MPTDQAQSRLRCHSLSSGNEPFHPHPHPHLHPHSAKAHGLPRPGSRKRARLSRSKSTSNVFDAFSRPPDASDYNLSKPAPKQVDIATLRKLAGLSETAEPSRDRPVSRDDCLRLLGLSERGGLSPQSLRRNKQVKPQKDSVQRHLPEHSVPVTTVDGRHYIAISTPALEKGTASGSSFQPQYPVFSPLPSPTAGLGAWPERISSKAALFATGENRFAKGDSKPPACSPSGHAGQVHSSKVSDGKGSLPAASSNKINADYLLQAMPNSDPVDGGLDDDLRPLLKTSSHPRIPTLEQPKVQSLPMMAVHEKADCLDGHQQAAPSPLTSSTTFPYEIRTHASRSPVGSGPFKRTQSSASTVPLTAQPKEARTSAGKATSVSVASLGDILTQRQPSPKLDGQMQESSTSHSCAMVGSSSTSRSPMVPTFTKPGEPRSLLQEQILFGTDQGLKGRSRLNGPCKESILSSRNGSDECQRESMASQLTATVDCCQQSIFTCSSPRSSLASEISIQSTAVASQKLSGGAEQVLGEVNLSTAEQYASTNVREMESMVSAACKDEARWKETRESDFSSKQELPRRPGSRLSTASYSNTEVNTNPKSMLNWRMARKAKVREYKMRDLDASRVGLVDSPGPVTPTHTMTRADNPTTRGASAPIESGRISSIPSMTAHTNCEASKELRQVTDTGTSADLHHAAPLTEIIKSTKADETCRTPRVRLNISSVITTEIEPIPPLAPRWHTSGMTISPIMVVANVESQPGSPTLRSSTRPRPESFTPRTMLRPKPLKLSPQPRQKGQTVTISRNPFTGAIERSAVGPQDSKFNRRSLMTMPTPPLSPEAARVSKRLSLPPVKWHLPAVPKGRMSLLRPQEWHFPHAEDLELEPEPEPESELESDPEPGSRLQSTTLKERVMREKLQKEREIMDIVAKTVGLPQEKTVHDDESDPLPLEQNNAETLEKRIRRLERNKDAWLCAMKPLLETMARTLDDMRADDKGGSLKMSDFIIDTEAEARRVTHSRHGETENSSAILQRPGNMELKSEKTGSALESFDPTPLSPIPQELDSPGPSDDQETPVAMRGQSTSVKKAVSSTTSHAEAGFSDTTWGMKPQSYEAMKRATPQQETMVDNPSNDWGMASSDFTSKGFSISSGAVSTQGRVETLAVDIGADGVAESGSMTEAGESSDWSDVDPLILELSSMPRKSKDFGVRNREAIDGNGSVNELSPTIMRELMSASQLWAGEAGIGH
ncbi:hypothetical protein F4861DRAFT_525932 [Xylaria intraflava]|nr:hypothetical protein F4861DRAFT_525932 [Xylaria intraflava]